MTVTRCLFPIVLPPVAAMLAACGDRAPSQRPVYTDPVVRFGCSRGLEPVLYVRKILDRFEHYRQFVPAGADER